MKDVSDRDENHFLKLLILEYHLGMYFIYRRVERHLSTFYVLCTRVKTKDLYNESIGFYNRHQIDFFSKQHDITPKKKLSAFQNIDHVCNRTEIPSKVSDDTNC